MSIFQGLRHFEVTPVVKATAIWCSFRYSLTVDVLVLMGFGTSPLGTKHGLFDRQQKRLWSVKAMSQRLYRQPGNIPLKDKTNNNGKLG